MLPNLDEIYSGEYIGGKYLIFDMVAELIPVDLFVNLYPIEDGEYRLLFFDNMFYSITFSLEPNVEAIYKIIMSGPEINSEANIFKIILTPQGQVDRVEFFNDSIYAIQRMFKIPEPSGAGPCMWETAFETPAYPDWQKFFSMVDISDNVPVWGMSAVSPLNKPIGPLSDASISKVNLRNCLLAINRSIDINAFDIPYRIAAYLEDGFKWRLSIRKHNADQKVMIFEYLNNEGERIEEKWWDGNAWDPALTAPLINMSRYGIDLFCTSSQFLATFGFCTVLEDLTLTRDHATDYAKAIDLIQEAALRLGINIPYTIQTTLESDRSVIDKNAQLLLGSLNSIAYYSTTLYDWPSMRVDGIYNVKADNIKELDTNIVFPGYDKMITDGFICNIDKDRMILIQQTTEDKYVQLANMPQNEATAIDNEGFNLYILRGNRICFSRPLKNGSTLRCVYKTRFPVVDAVTKKPVPRFTNDNDLSYIDSELLVIGIILNYKSYIGDDYRKEAQVFDEYAKYLKSTRAGNRIIKETNQIPYDREFPSGKLM
jgi:hypothetical protein